MNSFMKSVLLGGVAGFVISRMVPDKANDALDVVYTYLDPVGTMLEDTVSNAMDVVLPAPTNVAQNDLVVPKII